MEKTCSGCKLSKPLADFSNMKRASDGLNWYCRACCSEKMKQWRLDNLEHARKRGSEREAKSRKADPEWNMKNNARRYGLTLEEYKVLISKPCAICKSSPATCIDHCHQTNVVRGGLCSPCNTGLGHFKDSPELLEAAIKYLAPVV